MNTLCYGDNLGKLLVRLFLITVLFMTGGLFAAAQEPKRGDEAEVLTLDQQWQNAIVTGDVKFIERRTAKDFVFTHAGETTATQRQTGSPVRDASHRRSLSGK